jgi:hypothetical protein
MTFPWRGAVLLDGDVPGSSRTAGVAVVLAAPASMVAASTRHRRPW